MKFYTVEALKLLKSQNSDCRGDDSFVDLC
jgi:hypothetical protein